MRLLFEFTPDEYSTWLAERPERARHSQPADEQCNPLARFVARQLRTWREQYVRERDRLTEPRGALPGPPLERSEWVKVYLRNGRPMAQLNFPRPLDERYPESIDMGPEVPFALPKWTTDLVRWYTTGQQELQDEM
jgi:hypothetical protein